MHPVHTWSYGHELHMKPSEREGSRSHSPAQGLGSQGSSAAGARARIRKGEWGETPQSPSRRALSAEPMRQARAPHNQHGLTQASIVLEVHALHFVMARRRGVTPTQVASRASAGPCREPGSCSQ